MDGLTIIGESLNDSVPSTHELYESRDMDGLLALAKKQDEAGAAYIDVNVGVYPAEFMGEMVRQIQSVTSRPLSIDSPDIELARAGLEAYDLEKSEGKLPILNSISLLRTEMFELYDICPFRPILLVSEQKIDGNSKPCTTPEETYQAAKMLREIALNTGDGIANDDMIFDLGIAPIGSDSEGNLARLLAALRMIHDDPEFTGFHAVVGLSNFTVMLPSKRASGELVKGPLQSAFLTRAMPLGLDMIIGSATRKYEALTDDHPAMQCVDDAVRLGGFEAIMRVSEFYSS